MTPENENKQNEKGRDEAQRGRTMSEWMRVMLDEIDRKKKEAEEAREELEKRDRERK